MNLWLLSFIISLVLFFILVDFKKIIPNIFIGISAIVIQISIDRVGTLLNLYKIDKELIPICYSSLFFTYGPVFIMGVVFAQYYPLPRHLKVLNVFVWTVFFFLFEFVVHAYNYLIYTNWNAFYSLQINVLVFLSLSFLCEIFVLPHKQERM